jgi:isoleucyl-tRNA synthetase
MAPVIPFVTEAIYQNIKLQMEPESIHLSDWPKTEKKYRNLELERDMRIVRQAVTMGRSLRVANDIKIRQPLASIQLISRVPEEREVLARMEDILREELNVKAVVIHEKEEDLVEYHAKANFRVLGKELGPFMKEAATKIANLSSTEIARLLDGEQILLALSSGEKIALDSSRVDIIREEKQGLKVLNEGSLTVALDTSITSELLYEGYVRDLIRGIQNARKEKGLDVTDRIILEVSGDGELRAALDRLGQMVADETLALRIDWKDIDKAMINGFTVEAGDKAWIFNLEKA